MKRPKYAVMYWASQPKPSEEANDGWDLWMYQFYKMNYREEWEAAKNEKQ